jgi:hypothetical protein
MRKFKNVLGGKKDKDDKKSEKATPPLRTRHSLFDGLSSSDLRIPQGN